LKYQEGNSNDQNKSLYCLKIIFSIYERLLTTFKFLTGVKSKPYSAVEAMEMKVTCLNHLGSIEVHLQLVVISNPTWKGEHDANERKNLDLSINC